MASEERSSTNAKSFCVPRRAATERTPYSELIEIGPPRLTSFERARIIGVRALQIAMGAPTLLAEVSEKDTPVDIAARELETGALPLIIVRRLPNGEEQLIPLHWLVEAEKEERAKEYV